MAHSNLYQLPNREVQYWGIEHQIHNLLTGVETQTFLEYIGGESRIYHYGFFKNPDVIGRIFSIFQLLNLESQDQQRDILGLFLWLNKALKPFLVRVQRVVPDLYQKIDSYLGKMSSGLTLQKIFSALD